MEPFAADGHAQSIVRGRQAFRDPPEQPAAAPDGELDRGMAARCESRLREREAAIEELLLRAEERDRLAELRDRRADERDRLAERRPLGSPEEERAAAARDRARALVDRYAAGVDRDLGAGDRADLMARRADPAGTDTKT